MMTESKGRKSKSRAGPIEVKLPGFLVKREIGLGQLIKRRRTQWEWFPARVVRKERQFWIVGCFFLAIAEITQT